MIKEDNMNDNFVNRKIKIYRRLNRKYNLISSKFMIIPNSFELMELYGKRRRKIMNDVKSLNNAAIYDTFMHGIL